MIRSKGALSKRTKKLIRRKRSTISELIKSFSIGQKVLLSPTPYRMGLPNPKYANRHGEIVEKRGDSYVVRIRDGKKKKDIVAHPIHLKLAS